jgi:uncharacterized protein YigA (DUF484 family)
MTTPLDSGVIADYLLDHPHFFEEHAELLSSVKLASPLLGRAVSLQERQMEILRDKIRTHELHAAKLMRIARENEEIAHKFQLWTYAVLRAKTDANLPQVLVDELVRIFDVPQATLRLWDLPASHSNAWYAAPASGEARQYATNMNAPFCGVNQGFDAVSWLPKPEEVVSVAMIALRPAASAQVQGLFIFGSNTPERFSPEMSTDFLARIGETASAALSHLFHSPAA